MLTEKEKNNLYILISSILGEDVDIKSYKMTFNERTIEIVEDMIRANIHCNNAMKNLLSALIATDKLSSKGWLKKTLNSLDTMLSIQKENLNGYGCSVAAKARWKSYIITSTI